MEAELEDEEFDSKRRLMEAELEEKRREQERKHQDDGLHATNYEPFSTLSPTSSIPNSHMNYSFMQPHDEDVDNY